MNYFFFSLISLLEVKYGKLKWVFFLFKLSMSLKATAVSPPEFSIWLILKDLRDTANFSAALFQLIRKIKKWPVGRVQGHCWTRQRYQKKMVEGALVDPPHSLFQESLIGVTESMARMTLLRNKTKVQEESNWPWVKHRGRWCIMGDCTWLVKSIVWPWFQDHCHQPNV